MINTILIRYVALLISGINFLSCYSVSMIQQSDQVIISLFSNSNYETSKKNGENVKNECLRHGSYQNYIFDFFAECEQADFQKFIFHQKRRVKNENDSEPMSTESTLLGFMTFIYSLK